MIDFEQFPKARIFATHGVEFVGQRGDELYGSCPFTEKRDKFYVNTKTWLWDSKSAGMSGNVPQFLAAIQEDYASALDAEALVALARDRRLPRAAFQAWNIGWTGEYYTLPVLDLAGHTIDLRRYWLTTHKMKSTAGCHVGLMGAHRLNENLSDPVYICEGEWDAVALHWLLQTLKLPGVVVGVPGAGTFKQDWAPWFSGRRVHAIYDNDQPGMDGEDTMRKRIGSIAKSLTYCHWTSWSEDLPDGFDLRDWIVHGAIKRKQPEKCFERLQFLFKKTPRSEQIPETQVAGRVIKLVGAKKKVLGETPTLQQVHDVFTKWLHLPSVDAVDVMLASVLSQRIDGPPIWMFLVSPPGGAKTITLSALTDYERVYSTSSLTAHALISGANWQGQTDPSLIPRLDGKILVIKDFTSVLGLRETDKEEIFSILRDAYDGKCGKIFGNGVERSYVSRFSIVAAVTPTIYNLGEQHQSLGERFLKYMMGDNLEHDEETDIISRAIDNVDQDTRIKEELAAITTLFLTNSREDFANPTLDNDLHRKIVALAKFGARLRGTVSRDTYRAELMRGRPFAEVGSRLGIQLSKLARSLALVRGLETVGEAEYRIVKKIMLDTVSQRNEDLIRAILRACPTKADFVSTADLAAQTQYSQSTISRVLDDMQLLRVVTRRGSGWRYQWTLSEYIRKCIEESDLYTEPTELGRKIPIKIRLVKKRGRVEEAPTLAGKRQNTN